MAVKKATTKTSSASASKQAATKKTTTKKAGTSKAPAVKAATASKAGTPKASASATKKAAPKKAATVKLTDRQLDLLKTVHGTREQGYPADKKAETKTLDALAGKKLIKRGAKDKASGHPRYLVSKAGAKHLTSSSTSA